MFHQQAVPKSKWPSISNQPLADRGFFQRIRSFIWEVHTSAGITFSVLWDYMYQNLIKFAGSHILLTQLILPEPALG